MKKILATLFILILTFGTTFGATETATVTLNAIVGETTANSGVRVSAGDLSGDFSTAIGYDSLFASAVDDLVINPTSDLSVDDVEGYFTVFVKRLTEIPMLVTVDATTMQMIGQPHYLGYSLTSGTILLSTVGDVEVAPSTQDYTAENYLGGGLRDARSFKYQIPSDTTAPFGTYRAVVSFTITTI